jgi:hypothetical protein
MLKSVILGVARMLLRGFVLYRIPWRDEIENCGWYGKNMAICKDGGMWGSSHRKAENLWRVESEDVWQLSPLEC